jgi:hypothetical protein
MGQIAMMEEDFKSRSLFLISQTLIAPRFVYVVDLGSLIIAQRCRYEELERKQEKHLYSTAMQRGVTLHGYCDEILLSGTLQGNFCSYDENFSYFHHIFF